MKRDIVLTVFANSAQAPNEKWAQEYFKSPPLVLSLPGGGGVAFRAKINQWAKTGDLFQAAIKELAPKEDIEIGKRIFVTFSAGWAAMDALLQYPAEIDKLDAYLLLDGCHTTALTNWITLGSKASEGKMIMICAHSAIIPPFISSTQSNDQIFENSETTNATALTIPDFVSHAILPEKGIDISLGASPGMPATHRHWINDPYTSGRVKGNLVELSYSGNDAPTHCFIAWYVAERLWKWLGELINEQEVALISTPVKVIVPQTEPTPPVEIAPTSVIEENPKLPLNINWLTKLIDAVISIFKK